MKRKFKIALALGGGGARGCAHIGVLKALENADIPIDLITGSSIGAVVGGIYANTPNAQEMHDKFSEFLESKEYRKSGLELFKRKESDENFFGQVATNIKARLVINIAQSKTSLVSARRLEGVLKFLIPDCRIQDTKIPFYGVTSDVSTGEQKVFSEGDLLPVAIASAAIPGFLPPHRINGDLMVDGSVVCPTPVIPAKELDASLIIAVDVSQALNDSPKLDNVINVMFQTQHMTAKHYNNLILKQADIVIRPNVGDIHWSEFKQLNFLVEEGERVTREILPQIKQIIRTKNGLWNKIFQN